MLGDPHRIEAQRFGKDEILDLVLDELHVRIIMAALMRETAGQTYMHLSLLLMALPRRDSLASLAANRLRANDASAFRRPMRARERVAVAQGETLVRGPPHPRRPCLAAPAGARGAPGAMGNAQ